MTNLELINIAKNAWKNAFAEITGYKIGAAVIAKSGTVYIGTNVEEKAIPNLSCCAERVAIQNAIAHGEREFVALAVVGGREKIDDTLIPCGVCLQYITDMCDNIDIISYIDGKVTSLKAKDYLKIQYKYED